MKTEMTGETHFKAKYEAARKHSERLYNESKAKKKEYNQLQGEIVRLKRDNAELEKSLAMEEAEERALDSGVANISTMSRSPMSPTVATVKLPPPPTQKKTTSTPRKSRTPLKTVTNVSALFDQHEEQQASQSTALSEGLTRLTVATKTTKSKPVPELPDFESLALLLDSSMMTTITLTVVEEVVSEKHVKDAFCFTVDFAKFKTLTVSDMPSVSTHAKYADPMVGRIEPLGIGFQRRDLGHPGLVNDFRPCHRHCPEEQIERLSQQLKNIKLNEMPPSTPIHVDHIDVLTGSSQPIENAFWLLDHLATTFIKSDLLAVGTFIHLLDVMTIVKHLIMECPFSIVEIIHHQHRVLVKLIELISRAPTDFNHHKYTILVTHILRMFSELVR